VTVTNTDLQAFRRTYGEFGETERRTVPLARARMTQTGDGSGRLKVVGHASVFNSPSVEMRSPRGRFTEFIAPHAFDAVLARKPDVLLTWDHDSSLALARTTAQTLELSANAHGLRYFATVTPTSYAEDLRALMQDGVVNQSSFTFTVAPDGEEWGTVEGDPHCIVRVIHEVGDLYDVCVCAHGAYAATDSGIARSLYLNYALQRGYLRANPDAKLRAAKLRADLELRRKRLLFAG
jgi:HK97 family phage prohead protease